MAETPRTVGELAEQIEALVTAPHDYETSADALWKTALLAFDYTASQLGVSGFQGSFAALKFYGKAMGINGPFSIIKAEDAVYPQYDILGRVQKLLKEDWRPWMVDQASRKLAETPDAHPRVLAHWQALASEGSNNG